MSIVAEMLQEAISKDEKTEKDAKEKTGADKDKPDKAARDNKDKKEGKGFCRDVMCQVYKAK